MTAPAATLDTSPMMRLEAALAALPGRFLFYNATSPTERLALVRAALAEGGTVPAGDLDLVLAALDHALASRSRDLHRDLNARRRAERDVLIRQWCADHAREHRSVRAAATAFLTALRRYEASAWTHDCNHVACPDRLIGKPGEILWRLKSGGADIPRSTRMLANILVE